MSDRLMVRQRTIGSAFVVGAMVTVASSITFTACAESDESAPDPDGGANPKTLMDAAGADSDLDATGLAPCDASDPRDASCIAERLPCSATDWCPVETPVDSRYLLTAVWGSSSTDIWTIGSGGTIAHWDGTRWVTTASGTNYTFWSIWGAGPRDIWVVSTADVILRSGGFEGGTAIWERVQPALEKPSYSRTVPLRSVWGPRDGNEVLIGGVGGDEWSVPSAWRSNRDAIAWSGYPGLPTIPTSFTVYGIWGSPADDVWIVGEVGGAPGGEGGGGAAFHGKTRNADGGSEALVRTDIRALNRLEAVWGSGERDVWAVGTHGTIRHFTGGSARWETVASPTSQDLHAVWGTGQNDVWIVGDEGTLIHWDGVKWNASVASLPAGAKPNFYGVWGAGPNDVWAVGESGTVLHFTGHSTEMKSATQGDGP